MTSSKFFAGNLKERLCAFYGGRMPSFSTVARDFALRSPHLKHVSSETIRKWVRGSSLPTVDRLLVLNEWFQCDLMLETKNASNQSNDRFRAAVSEANLLLQFRELIPLLILKLNQQDQNLIYGMIHAFATEQVHPVHSSNGPDISIADLISSEQVKLKNENALKKSNNIIRKKN
jgi:hypothetical protein